MDKFESLEKAMCKELESLERKVQSSPEMNVADLDKIDKLAHALKSLATYKAMVGCDYEEERYSGRMSGRYAYGAPMPYHPPAYDYPPTWDGRYR